MRWQKIFFLCLVFLGLCPATYFSFRTACSLIDFITYKGSAPARILRWEVKEAKGKFPLKAYYSFDANGELWHGATRLKEPWHLNEASAVAAIQEKAKNRWIVWFNPDDPMKSSLEKSFPVGLLIRTLACYGVILYFILLHGRVLKNNL